MTTRLPEEGVELRRTANGKGDGVVATRPFAAGETVMVGFLIGALTGNDSHATQVGPGRWSRLGGLAPKVNHSCDPNCGVRLNEGQAFDYVARRPISVGEELTFDYAMRNFTIDHFPPVCTCGAARCRGSVTGWKDLPAARKVDYGELVAPYLRVMDGDLRSPPAVRRRSELIGLDCRRPPLAWVTAKALFLAGVFPRANEGRRGAASRIRAVSTVVSRVLRVLAAVAVVIGGYSHYHLWDVAYRHTPVKELFLVNAAASLVVGIGLVVGPRRLAALGGIGVSFLTLLAFGLSRGPGVPTFHGTFTESGLEPSNVHVLGVNVALLTVIVEGVALLLSVAVLGRGPGRASADVGVKA